ncbi:sensor histidine kinase [Nocardioides campestrisoli]|uniref:sensor histidine kinase n=1 Tax=Nocardioides campestrisoli TaxID=2736757 RepID=UPI00163D583D|nr:sensor histidine kinase [Nocardioides campestrisoli]
MRARAERLQHAGLIEGGRAFVLLTIAVSVAWSRSTSGLGALFCLATLWVLASWLLRSPIPLWLLCLVEAVLVATIAAGFTFSAPGILAALAVPPFTHALLRGFRGVAEALGVQITTFALVVLASGPVLSSSQIADVFTWLVTGLGIGLVTSFFVGAAAQDEGTAAYREARVLIADLNELSSKLEGGLDPTSMGGAILEEVTQEIPAETVVLHVRRNGVLLPLVSRSSQEEPDPAEIDELAQAIWEDEKPRVLARDFGFPVYTSGSVIAVVTGRLAPDSSASPATVLGQLEKLADRLTPAALRLDTAQLFTAFRDAAMSDERRRLAREMHDGVAQDIASMGYVVDALLSTAPGPAEEKALLQLRRMITTVVAEVRRSVMTLRTQAGSSESLGAAIATLARHLSDVSGIPIKVTVDERTSRLRHEVEAELLRIAQEAMNNAVKHSRATLIDVHCRVQAPSAQIVVSDDGGGLQGGRRDSHGLSIMKERAALIGGVLEVRSSPARGTVVSVRVGAPLESSTIQPAFTDHRSAKVS